MVVLEGGGMVTIGNNQYLQPDYLSPLPTTLDAKKSPLALLAQTCSNIGADSSNVKSILSVDKNSKKSELLSKSPPSGIPTNLKMDKSSPSASLNLSNNTIQSSSSEIKLAFKPYEMNVLTKKCISDERPSSKDSNSASENLSLSNNHNNNNLNSERDIKISNNNNNNSSRVPSRSKTESPSSNHGSSVNEENGKHTPSNERKSGSPSASSQNGASPIIRSGLEVLQGHAKDAAMSMYKPGNYPGINPLTGLCCPPGMEQHTNPAFRPPFAGAFSQHHAAMLAAAAGYSNSGAPPGTFLSYARVKTPSGGEALVPVCKDPYCTGCPFSAHNQQMMMGSPCPAGCTQCEHQKYGLMAAMSASLPPGHPYSQLGRPYTCSWISGESYCGKRFNTSDELLSHVRTHTSNLNDPAAIAALTAAQSPLLNPLFSPSALHRAYTNPPLSPLSASRYHPYAKPGSLPPGLSPTSFPGFNPSFPYYSPYALYGQRLGAAAVHQ